MHVTGSSQTARLGRAICACLGGIMLAGLLAACGESSRLTHLAPTPEPTPVAVQLLAMVPSGRTMPPVEPSPPPRTPEVVTTMAPPTPTPTPTPADDGADTPTPTPTAEPTGPLTPEEIGSQLFVDNGCFVCHAEDLSGGIGPALAGRTPEDLTDDRIRSQIGTGGNGMPLFENLTAEQIEQLMAFIRSS